VSESGARRPDATTEHASGAGLARNAFNLVVGQAVTTALAIVLSAALARKLGAQDFGLYFLVTTMCTFAYVFVEWGQPYFVIRQLAREPLRSGEVLGSALVLRLVLTIAVTVPAGLIAWALGYGPRTTWLLVLLVLGSAPQFLFQGYSMVFRARDRMGSDAVVSVAYKALTLGLTLPALALGTGIPGCIVALAVAAGGALMVARRLYGRLGVPPLRFEPRMARELLVAGVPILAMTAATSAQPYLDAIILSKLVPAAVMGWFGAAKGILGTLMAPAVILGTAAYPRIARASGDPVLLRREVRSAFRPLLLLGALAATGTYLFAGAVIGLIYGSRGFGPAATILEVFSPGLFLLFVDILLGNVLYASGRGTGFAVAKVASVLLGTALDLLLIPLFQQRFGNGGIGVLVAFALSELTVFTGAMIVLPRGILGAATGLDVVRALGAAAATIAVLRLMPAVPPWVGIPLCVGLFGAASIALGLVDRRDLSVLQSLLRRQPIEAAPTAPSSIVSPDGGGSTRRSQHSRQNE
jgi:O-antigen/teichoic acid export membrane protein